MKSYKTVGRISELIKKNYQAALCTSTDKTLFNLVFIIIELVERLSVLLEE